MATAIPLKGNGSAVPQQFGSSDTVPPANLGSGSPSSSKYLRGDGAWTVPTASEVGALSSSSYPWAFSFGTGADGDATIAASANWSGLKQYNNLTINSGVVWTMNGPGIIFVRGLLTVNGTIDASGGSASPSNLQAGAAGFGVWSATQGGAGQGSTTTGSAATAGAILNGSAFGMTGGAGGAGGSVGGTSGGAGGTIGAAPNMGAVSAQLGHPWYATLGELKVRNSGTVVISNAGGGGGGGAGDGTSSGGGGGGPGGHLVIVAARLAGTGNIYAKGGDGGSRNSGTNVAGGGGGGGGCIVLVSTSASHSLNLSVAGGVGGTGRGTGGNGTNGSTGFIYPYLGG